MEESITLKAFLEFYKKTMEMGPVDAGTYSPLVLAYIGDAVYEVMIRAKVVNKGSIQVNKLHKKSAELVKAGTQAAMIHLLEEDLTAQEHAVYKRGRNAKSFTMAKHATMADYRTATGFEALVGWLFLEEQFERLTQLVSTGLERIGALEMKTGSPEQKGES